MPERVRIDDAGEGGHKRHGHEDKRSEEHAPADDDGRAVFQDEADRGNRVKRAGKGGKEAPEERLGRKRQRRQVAGCRDEDRTDDGENGTEDFLPPRKPFFTHAVPHDDEDRHDVFENRRGRLRC